MSQPLTKKQLIAKIVKEQKVEPKSLERMNLTALQAMDKVVPDADEDLLGGSPSELPTDKPKTDVPVGEVTDNSETIGESLPNVDGAASSDSQESSSVEGNGEPVGQSVSSEDGVSIVTPSESPSEESQVSTETSQELPATSNADSGSGSGPVERILLGQHPVTEKPVYSDEQ